MWFNLFSFPFFFVFCFLLNLLPIKFNINRSYFMSMNSLLKFFILSLTFVNLRKSYNFLILNVLDTLINLFEMLPIIFKFVYKYRKFKYIEICLIQFITCNKFSFSLFKVVNELINFLLKFKNLIKLYYKNFKFKDFFFINFNINLKLINFYNKYYFNSSNLLNGYIKFYFYFNLNYTYLKLNSLKSKFISLVWNNLKNVS